MGFECERSRLVGEFKVGGIGLDRLVSVSQGWLVLIWNVSRVVIFVLAGVGMCYGSSCAIGLGLNIVNTGQRWSGLAKDGSELDGLAKNCLVRC